ncbi:Hcp transcriptional regulator HcpR (Crp/Fnr family) [Geitlerinema sp. FC II]|nr:Crp/Fnr family transcriptional regulator [Geitlerinema sp. CS-897]PPT11203.1 Hcp transcriptional regulator HcpR (Crp/Fnr family) [Geitlerinema sp. FC II]
MDDRRIFETGLFEGLPPEHVEWMAKIARPQKYRKGEPIFFEGDECKGFFIVKSGRVKVFKTSPDGKEQILHWFEDGERFAEVPAFDGGDYPASASAVEKTELLFFPKDSIVELVQKHPTLALNLLAALSRHLRRFAKLIDNLSFKEVPSRLAAYLLKLSDRSDNADVVKLDVTKGQLAAFLGTIPETLSRAFAKLAQEDIIAVEGAEVTLRDRSRLERLASGEKPS